MITNAYIIFKDMPQSPDAITRKEFRLQCAWGLILAGAEQVSTSQASQCTKLKSVQSNVREDTSLPLGRSCDCGHFPIHLEGEAIGVLALPLEGEGEPDKRRKASTKDSLGMFQVRVTAVSQR